MLGKGRKWRGAGVTGRRQILAALSSLQYSEQFDLEDKSGIRADGGSGALLAIRQFRWDDQAGFAADAEVLEAFSPARDDAIEREFGWFAALVGRIEFCAINQRASIMDADNGICLGAITLARLKDFHLQSGGCGHNAGASSIFGAVGIASRSVV